MGQPGRMTDHDAGSGSVVLLLCLEEDWKSSVIAEKGLWKQNTGYSGTSGVERSPHWGHMRI
jgi:hypothetical protein